MAKIAGMPSVSPYDKNGGRCSRCQINIPRHEFIHKTYKGKSGAIKHKDCGTSLRLHPRVSGIRKTGQPGRARREQKIRRIE